MRTWMGATGVNGSHAALARMLNVLPKEDDDANLMYLRSTAHGVSAARSGCK